MMDIRDWLNRISILIFAYLGILIATKTLPKETICNIQKQDTPPLIDPNGMDIEVEFNGERSRICDLNADYQLTFSNRKMVWTLFCDGRYVASSDNPGLPLTVYIRGQQWRIST